MEREEFYGVTLSEKEPLAQYEMEEPTTTAEDQKLVIKQICLGAEAKNGEFNVVQVSVCLTNTGVSNEENVSFLTRLFLFQKSYLFLPRENVLLSTVLFFLFTMIE
uniref:Nucleoplasmin-like protein n=1 Tax=Bactrocera latifrons TaxID=174628 RepID=A0A0K8VR72_BACLA